MIGIDYSLNSPGITIYDSEDDLYHHFFRWNNEKYFNKNSNLPFRSGKNIFYPTFEKRITKGIERYRDLALWTSDIILRTKSFERDCIIAFEGISYGSPGRVAQLAANMGSAQCYIWGYNFNNIVEVAPNTIKKFATGNGWAEKIEMISAFEAATGVDLTALFPDYKKDASPISDIVDSYWLCQYSLNNKDLILQELANPDGKKNKKKRRKKAKSPTA